MKPHLINEFREIEKFAETLSKGVSIFGSARAQEATHCYTLGFEVSALLASKGYSILSGGGPGVMRAANAGAKSVGGRSIGINIALPFEPLDTSLQDTSLLFGEFFTRKQALLHYSEAFVFLPGGVGTLDEAFELLTLTQTGKLDRKPIVFIDQSYWGGLLDWMRESLLKEGFIDEADFMNINVVDTAEEAAEYIVLTLSETTNST